MVPGVDGVEARAEKGQTVSRREATLRQRLAYLELGLQTEAALEEAIRLLCLGNSSQGREAADQQRLGTSIEDLRSHWTAVHADLVSFVAGDLRVHAPEPQIARRIRDRRALLVALTPDALPVVVLTLARDLVTQWESTKTASSNGTSRVPARHVAGRSNLESASRARAS